jgi:UDP-N-acetyl-D-mannosaminuronic acid dehydrogenase
VIDTTGQPPDKVAADLAASVFDWNRLHAAALPDELGSLGNVVLADTQHAVQDADVIALLTDHSCFRSIRKTALTGKGVHDVWGMWA